jgi:hypothetical protein
MKELEALIMIIKTDYGKELALFNPARFRNTSKSKAMERYQLFFYWINQKSELVTLKSKDNATLESNGFK